MNLIQKFLSKILPPRGVPITEAEETGWRRLTERAVKGLTQLARDKQLDIAFKLWLTNGVAKRAIDITNDYINGDGFGYDVEVNSAIVKDENRIAEIKKECLEVLKDFWKSNKMDLRFPKKTLDLSLNGMLVLPVMINEVDGSVVLGFVDPKNVDKVEVNPLNIEEIQLVKLKSNPATQKILKVIQINRDLQSEDFGMLDGECFYFAINNVSNQPEGCSDMIAAADYVDVLDQMVFNVMESTRIQNLFVDDVTLKNKSEAELKNWEKDNPLPDRPSRFVHNEDVEHEIMSPALHARDNAEVVRIIKNLGLATFGYPEHWFADGGNTNLATAVEQGAPTFRRLKNRQIYAVYILSDILMFCLHKAFGRRQGFSITRDELKAIDISIIAPDIETTNTKDNAETIDKVADGLKKGVESNWISEETAGQVYRTTVSTLGYSINEETEAARLQKTNQINDQKTNEKSNGVPNENGKAVAAN